MSANKTAQLAINTIRTLAIDAIQKANSGHPGTPLDAAPTAYTLWQQVLRYDPDHPNWLNRDRFVLSCGHASMLPVFDRTRFAPANGLAKGGYVLADAPDGKPDVILIGCGSEVSLCVQASERLTAEGIKTRVVSMPAWELFDEQDQQYQDSVLPPSVTARVAVEEASPIGWERYIGRDGVVLGMRTFGMSAPMKVVAEHFGFTPDHVAAGAKEVLARRGGGPR